MKAIWSGTISFGLVSIPIKLYAAVTEHMIGFTLLCGTCHTPIKYERWCKKCNKEVSWHHIVKGLKISEGKYFIASQESIAKLKPESTDVISIVEFVQGELIDPIYFERHYYIGPAKAGGKAFHLFKKALHLSKKAAIGTFIMREKQYVCAISPYEDGLLLSTLNYAYEIRSMESIPFLHDEPAMSAAELTLAKKLITELTTKKFSISAFKDTFAEHLKKAIKSATLKRIPGTPVPKKIVAQKADTSLLTSLKASLASPKKKVVKKK